MPNLREANPSLWMALSKLPEARCSYCLAEQQPMNVRVDLVGDDDGVESIIYRFACDACIDAHNPGSRTLDVLAARIFVGGT